MLKNNKYITFLEAVVLLIVVLFQLTIIYSISPLHIANAFAQVLVRLLVFGSVIYLVVRLRKLNAKVLFPLKETGNEIVYYSFLTIALFLIGRITLEIEELAKVGFHDYIRARDNRVFIPNPEKTKDFVSLILVGPIMEELFFRGLLFKSFLMRYSFNKAALLSSFLFAIFHIGFLENPISIFLFSFLFGLFLSWTLDKTNSIKVPIICHMLWNFTNIILLPLFFYVLNPAVKTPSQLLLTFLAMIVFAAALYFLGYHGLKRKYV